MITRLCHIDDLADPGAKGFEFHPTDPLQQIFLVKKDGQVYGYQNSCPHRGVNLEWQPDDFLNLDQTLIQCAVHGASFIIETGICINGPCAGASLTAIELIIDNSGNISYVS